MTPRDAAHLLEAVAVQLVEDRRHVGVADPAQPDQKVRTVL